MKFLSSWIWSYALASVVAGVVLHVTLLLSLAVSGEWYFSWLVIIGFIFFALGIFISAFPFALLLSALPERLGTRPSVLLHSIFGALSAFVASNWLAVSALFTTAPSDWPLIFDGIWLDGFRVNGPPFIASGLVGGLSLGYLRKKKEPKALLNADITQSAIVR